MAICDIMGQQINAAFDINSGQITKAYDKYSRQVWERLQHSVSANFTSTLLYDIPSIGAGTQGIACESLSQEIAQLYTGRILTISLSDGTYTERAYVRNLGHGSAGKFEGEKKSPSDLYPPLWVSTGTTKDVNGITYGQFIEVNLGETQSTINRAFFVPLNPAGYSLFAFDLENKIAYSVVYSAYNAGDDEDKWGYIEAYSIDDVTSFPEGAYSMASSNWVVANPIDRWDIEYLASVQSLTYHDGLIALLSDTGKVIFHDVQTHSDYLTISNNILPFEREGISFILNKTTGKYDMVLSARGNNYNVYYRYEFT